MDGNRRPRGIIRSWFGPAALAGAFLLALAALLVFIHRSIHEERLASLPGDADVARESLRARLAADREFLIRLAEDRIRGGLDEVGFQERAGRYAADRPEIGNVYWVGPDLVIHRTAVPDPARKTVGMTVAHPEQDRAIRRSMEARTPVYTLPFADARGNAAFDLWLPLHHGDAFLGLFGIAYGGGDLLRQVSPPHLWEDYWLALEDASGAAIAETPRRSSVDARLVHRLPLDPPGGGLRLRLQRYGTGVPGLGLWLLGLLCAALALGMAYGMFALKRDMARRRQAEEARDRLGMAVEQAAEAIIITDPEGAIQYVNPAFERVTGYGRDEVLGKNPRILKGGKHDAGFYRRMWSTLLNGDAWTGRFENRRKDGTLYEEEAVISPVRDAGGRIVNFVAVKRDVTHERQMEARLRQAQKMEAVGRLAGGIAHDFNNLLTAITGYSDLLLHRVGGDDPLSRDIALIRQAGERAASLTRQLLAFSRRQMLRPKVLDLNALVARLETMLRRVLGEDIELAVVPAPDLLPTKADPEQIDQVLLDLAVNAREAMPAGGRLAIETANALLDDPPGDAPEARRRYVMVVLRDTGRGMDEETMAHVFEPFFTTKGTGQGPGLGLATAYGIVSQSGGQLTVESEVGRGTTFRIYLPAVEEAVAAAGSAEVAAGTLQGRETVLLVEDEEIVRTLVRQVLLRAGYTVLEARDGVEAIEIGRRHEGPIDLMVTDVVMPRMGGRQAAERLAVLRPETKVLYMSGYAEDAIVHDGVLEEGTSFIQKPFVPDALARKVREVLDR